ncbi:hypothetical protein SAY86_008390 [Trapa natans]|uniref:RIN4 pathogenic type III effector avirulence factor Avr cleavage site domain-containing protein n=1 Tax=Trapa natans TaxID=22666 RepID=A0AAN7KF96_TRANT|nr:hypothetical protein SAY86_008390 [Trapa natans]
MAIPQFRGWDQKASGLPTNYSMVFSQARDNRKKHKNTRTDLSAGQVLGVRGSSWPLLGFTNNTKPRLW